MYILFNKYLKDLSLLLPKEYENDSESLFGGVALAQHLVMSVLDVCLPPDGGTP